MSGQEITPYIPNPDPALQDRVFLRKEGKNSLCIETGISCAFKKVENITA